MRSLKVKTFGAVTLACLMTIGSTALAVPIDYTSFTGTIINFDGLAGSSTLGAGETLTNQFAGVGVTFDVPNWSAHATTGVLASSTKSSDPNVIWVNQGGGSGGASALGMNINFSTPQAQVGLYFGTSLDSTATLSAYSGMTLLEEITMALPLDPAIGLTGFIAVSNSNITRVVVSSANSGGQNWNFSIDDLKFSAIPEPTTILLLGSGLVGLVGYGWKRKK